MPKLKIQGRAVDSLNSLDPLKVPRTEAVRKTESLQVTRRETVIVSTDRGGVADTVEIEANDDSILVLHLDGGFQLFCRHDQFREDFPNLQRDAGGAYRIDPNLGLQGANRQVGSLILKALEVFDVKPHESVALSLAARVERQLERAPGLYRLSLSPEFRLSDSGLGNADLAKPALIFIHGTASSSRGSFQALSLTTRGSSIDFAARLSELYGENVFAFEHKTLTESPVHNALQLAQALPANLELHLVSHSRGGLIGDLLALGQLQPDVDLAAIDTLFNGHSDRAALTELLVVLKQRKPLIKRYVRVACPARGTTLVSGRADRWFSMLLSLFGQLLDHLADPLLAKIYEALQDFLMAVAHERTNPALLPGLEAMLPTSALVRLLNLPGLRSSAALSVIAGSTEGKDFLSKIKWVVPDTFYSGQHDLIVNFASMDGGVAREVERSFPDKGPDVNHLSYFFNSSTRQALLDGLTRKDEANDGFQKFEFKQVEIPSRTVQRFVAGSRPLVFVLPGMFGSQLCAGDQPIWPDDWQLTIGGLGKLAIDAKGVTAASLIDGYYGKIVQYLGATHEVIPFPFDWRLSLQVEARRLADEIDKRVTDRQPLRIIGHSMGGLLARVMLAQNPALWTRIKTNPGGRMLMLGTPNTGTYEILRMLTGESRIVRQLSVLDVRRNPNEKLAILSGYPGLLELLPHDFLRAGAWAELSKADPRLLDRVRGSLAGAAATRKLLDESPFDERMIYVAGLAANTPVSMSTAGGKITFMATSKGDGRVPWATGIPKDVSAYYSTAQHGDLTNYEPDFPALLELLESGATTRLPKQPALINGLNTQAPMSPDVDEILPNRRDLAAAAMGASNNSSTVIIPKSFNEKIRVEVVHGNLAFARHTVAVGHYAGDSIVGAEAQIDQHLGGRLNVHNQLGVYPDRIGSAEVFLNSDKTSRPSGAVVVGLGKVCALTPKGLQETFYNAMLRYALAAKECPDDRFQHPRNSGITTLLVGTMANVLTIEESLTAILRAVEAANVALNSASAHQAPFRIHEVEVMELWEDRAILATEALMRISRTPEMKDLLDPVPRVGIRDGGLRRYASGGEESWWSRLRITQDAERGPLKFALFTNRARTEVEEVAEPERAGALIESAIASPAIDMTVSQALFEMLVPNRLKEYAPELTRLVLMVDENSARYPWELLHDRMGRHNRPLAVDTGLIRQLELDDYRPVVVQSDQSTALVVANPVTTKYPSLEGAEAEGQQVAEALKGLRVEVKEHIHSTGAAIRRDLYAGSYRILHLAGHGVHRYQTYDMPAPVSGMIIGDDDFLTPAEIGQLRPVPELVFLNCCHLGRTDIGRTDVVAANLAVEFIRIGVRAVIAAGWTVDDQAASTFATQFYQQFLDGVAFGEAVRVAREVTFQNHQHVNTWGAYQCYGDPGYRFTNAGPSANSARPDPPMVLPSQLALEINNLASRAKAAQTQDRLWIEIDLKKLEKREGVDGDWWDRPDVQAALGNLYGELGNYGKAIELYRKAAASESSTVPIRTIEQEANLRSRGAARDFVEGTIPLPKFLQQIQLAIERINVALSFGETSERCRVKASAYKRRATFVEDDADRIESLKTMTAAYLDADRLCSAPGEHSDPKMNSLLGSIVLRWFDATAPEEMGKSQRKALQESIDEGRRRASAHPSFWNSVIEPDGRLVQQLASGQLSESDAVAIGSMYRNAISQGSSPREVSTVVEHLDFVGRMAGRAGKPELEQAMGRVVSVLKWGAAG